MPHRPTATESHAFVSPFDLVSAFPRRCAYLQRVGGNAFWSIDCPIEKREKAIIMNKQIFLGVAMLAAFMQPAPANPVSRRATITGGGGSGRCTIEVTVDATAEVEVFGDTGLLTTTSGQPAAWQRFQCNAPLPSNPVGFRYVKIGGRGTARLHQDPRSTGGRAVVRIDDPKGGSARYTFDLQWGGLQSGGPVGGGWTPGPPPPSPGHWPGPRPSPEGFPMARTIRVCQDSVTSRLNRHGYQYVTFENTLPVNNPGRNDWVTGRANGTRGFGTTRFSFSCSVDFDSGRVHSVHVHRGR